MAFSKVAVGVDGNSFTAKTLHVEMTTALDSRRDDKDMPCNEL